ncbi:MAG: OmpW/AlkL family protein [Cloacibacterium caeni]
MRKLLFLAGLLFTVSLSAQNWQVRLRGVAVQPNENAEVSTIGGDVNISNSFIPELDFTYFFNKNVAAELILGTTKHDVKTTGSNLTAIGGPASAEVDLGSVWLLPPTLTLQYHFYPTKTLKPYLGAGLNYTIFYSVDEGSVVKGLDYDNAVGFALQGGLDYMLNDKYFLNFDIKKLFLKTDVNVDATNLASGLKIPAEVNIDPLLIGFGVGMKF